MLSVITLLSRWTSASWRLSKEQSALVLTFLLALNEIHPYSSLVKDSQKFQECHCNQSVPPENWWNPATCEIAKPLSVPLQKQSGPTSGNCRHSILNHLIWEVGSTCFHPLLLHLGDSLLRERYASCEQSIDWANNCFPLHLHARRQTATSHHHHVSSSAKRRKSHNERATTRQFAIISKARAIPHQN